MTSASEAAKARLTSEEKGKGKRKRLASVDQADNSVGDDGEDGDNGQDIVDTTERQFTRSKRRDTGQATPIDQEGVPTGLAFVPLPPSLLYYKDLVPERILQAVESFFPSPVARKLRERAPPPVKNKNNINAAPPLPNPLRLQKELVEAQTQLIEKDIALNQQAMIIHMLSQELKLCANKFGQMGDVMHEVEMERDNYKAGEGLAKEVGKGFKVKLEDTGEFWVVREVPDTQTESTSTGIIEQDSASGTVAERTANAVVDLEAANNVDQGPLCQRVGNGTIEILGNEIGRDRASKLRDDLARSQHENNQLTIAARHKDKEMKLLNKKVDRAEASAKNNIEKLQEHRKKNPTVKAFAEERRSWDEQFTHFKFVELSKIKLRKRSLKTKQSSGGGKRVD